MKIKIHNCLLKKDYRLWLLPYQLNIYSHHAGIYFIRYKISNYYYFLEFNIRTKKFEEAQGFGMKVKNEDKWWLDSNYNWKDAIR